MEEETKTQEQEPVVEAPKGPVERATEAVAKAEAFEKRLDEKIAKLQDLESRRVLGGGTSGPEKEEKKEEMSALEYSKKALAGELDEKAN